jgi:PAS domain S-box-containing protein
MAIRDDNDRLHRKITLIKQRESRLLDRVDQKVEAAPTILESEAFFNALFNNQYQFLAVLSTEGVIIKINQAGLDFGCVTEEEVLGRYFWDTNWFSYSGELQTELQIAIAQAKAGRHALCQVKNVLSGAGTLHTVDASFKGIKEANGEIRFIMAEGHDVTEQQQLISQITLKNQQLQESLLELDRLHFIVNQAPVLIGFWDNQLKNQFGNDVYSTWFGKTPQQIKGLHIRHVLGEVVYRQYLSEINGALDGKPQMFERYITANNGNKKIRAQIRFIPHIVDAKVSGFYVLGVDVTDQEALMEANYRHNAILENISAGILLTDKNQLISYCNPAFQKLTGYSFEDILGKSSTLLQGPETDQQTLRELKKALDANQSFQGELINYRKDGSAFWNELTISPIFDTKGQLTHFVDIQRDITQRKQVEAKLNAIFNASVEGIMTTDMDNIIVSVNTAVEAILGYKPEELMGCSINKLMPSSTKEKNACGLTSTAKSGIQIQEIEGLHKNGSMVPLDMSLSEYSIDNAHYFTYIVRDVSLRKRREKQDRQHLDQLAHVTRVGLMGEMASGIAHEVNQPLTAISNYTQVSLNLINTDNPDLVNLAEILYKTQQQALRAGRIIHRMREFIKSHSKHTSTANINTLIHDAASLCATELKHNGIELTFELENNLPPIQVDHIHIEQVIINLIRNGIDALENLPAKQQRCLSIRSRLTLKNSVEVRIKDNGPGIDKDQQQKILMPFYTTKTGGMGMGLSISRSLLEAHGGTLYFKSKPGKSCSFYFTLPTRKTPDEF